MKDDPVLIFDKLQRLGQLIDEARIKRMKRHARFRGADVEIADPNFVASLNDRDVVVRTVHADELSWLFFELRDAFGEHISFANKFGFYSALSQCAIQHLKNSTEDEDFRPLLREVLKTAYGFYATLVESGSIPRNSAIVIHSRDESGQPVRFEL